MYYLAKEKSSKLIIADPSLADRRGHHFSLSMQITQGALDQGLDVVWLTHRDFVTPTTFADIRVYPVFSATMYDRYLLSKKHCVLEKPEFLLLWELQKAISAVGICANDHIFFHTAFADTYRAIIKYFSTPTWRQSPYIHLCTPYDLETMPGKHPGSCLPTLFRDLRTQQAVDEKLFFWAETPQLASHFTFSFGFNVRALLLPPVLTHADSKPGKDTKCVTALYLGPAREEKGFLALPRLAKRLYEPYGVDGKLRFVIQCSPQIIGYLPTITATIKTLSNFPDNYLQLVDRTLSEDEYYSFLLASDVVLLLYNKNNYRVRGSGIAVEAVSSGISILTYKHTFCSSLITDGGGRAVDNVEEAIEALADIVERKNHYRERALLQSERYRNNNRIDMYINRLFQCSAPMQKVPFFFPSNIVGHLPPILINIE